MFLGRSIAALLLLGSAHVVAADAPVIHPAPIAYAAIDWAAPPLRTRYASPDGRGTGASHISPLALVELLPTLQAGDRLILVAGRYPSATVTAKGTAAHPISIEAQHPACTSGFRLNPCSGTRFNNTSLTIKDSSYLRVHGMSFDVDLDKKANGITILASHHLAITRNYFFQQTSTGLLIGGKASAPVSQV
ncbi:MAG TPA: hypothetical protein VHL31_12915, partial [Geminicoccus sp.]|uniref:hypothetical protein n=1 Tax=Geminicoccus sp. TaxID=2024832 RepID=UPI002E31CC0C